MRKAAAEGYRDIDFSRAKRGAIVKPEPGKTKISIRLDNTVIEFFRATVERAGGGNYQTLINEALLHHIHGQSTLDAVRQVVREELAPYRDAPRDSEGAATEGQAYRRALGHRHRRQPRGGTGRRKALTRRPSGRPVDSRGE